MSSPRTRIITLNLGSQSIELAEFRAQPSGGLILCGYRSCEFLADPVRGAGAAKTPGDNNTCVSRSNFGNLGSPPSPN
jgi:hypothetical protein